MLKSNLCDYSNAYIVVKGIKTVPNTVAAAAPNNRIKKVVFENCAPFTYCISKINNTQIDNVKDIDVVMDMCNLTEYSETDFHASGNVWQYYKDQPALNDNGNY